MYALLLFQYDEKLAHCHILRNARVMVQNRKNDGEKREKERKRMGESERKRGIDDLGREKGRRGASPWGKREGDRLLGLGSSAKITAPGVGTRPLLLRGLARARAEKITTGFAGVLLNSTSSALSERSVTPGFKSSLR